MIALPLLLSWAALAQIVPNTESTLVLTPVDVRYAIAPKGAPDARVPLQLDPSVEGEDAIDVNMPLGRGAVTLLLPDGTEVGPANASARGFTYDEFDATPDPIPSFLTAPGHHVFMTLPSGTIPGGYVLKVDASGAADDVGLMVTYVSSSSVRAVLTTDAPSYRVGDDVLLFAMLKDGDQPVSADQVTVYVGDPSDAAFEPLTVTLTDSGPFDAARGDGIYTGHIVLERAGEYTASVQATGRSTSGVAFSRNTSTSFRVLAPTASFSSFTDHAADDDSDGKLDRIVVTANLNVTVAGTYRFAITLAGPRGTRLRELASGHLHPGTASLSVSFAASDVASLGGDGPYALQQATLSLESAPDSPVVDYRDDAGPTAAYALASFRSVPLSFTGNHGAQGVDTDGDGKLDTIQVQAEVVSGVAGDYQWSGRLVQPAESALDSPVTLQTLPQGTQTLTLSFRPAVTAEDCALGPYAVQTVALRGSGGSLVIPELFQTQTFTAADFGGADCSSSGGPTPPGPKKGCGGCSSTGAPLGVGLLMLWLWGRRRTVGA